MCTTARPENISAAWKGPLPLLIDHCHRSTAFITATGGCFPCQAEEAPNSSGLKAKAVYEWLKFG